MEDDDGAMPQNDLKHLFEKTDSKNSENKIISKTFLGSTIRYKIGTNKTKNGILIVDKSSNDSEVFNPGDYVKINILQDWKTEP